MGFIGIVAVLTILALSLVITRVATVALTMTGLSRQVARFQARSALTGTGFTTSEAETVVNHPVRRQAADEQRRDDQHVRSRRAAEQNR